MSPAELPVLGTGDFRFVPEPDWPRLPAGLELGDVAGLAVDAQDRVVLFNRGPHPVIVVDAAGELVTHWGEDEFVKPHGAAFGPDGALYLTDNGLHVVRKYTLEGELLLQLGTPGAASAYMSNEPFNRCTHTAVTSTGEILVTDGYGNAAVHRFSADGEYVDSWGGPGVGLGEFNNPHNVAVSQGRVYVVDRENDRVQVFSEAGEFLSQLVK